MVCISLSPRPDKLTIKISSCAMVGANYDGEIIETHSISAGLDYPGVGPEHAWLKDIGRAEYVSVTDDEKCGCRVKRLYVQRIMVRHDGQFLYHRQPLLRQSF
jgi:hypothetical protein